MIILVPVQTGLTSDMTRLFVIHTKTGKGITQQPKKEEEYHPAIRKLGRAVFLEPWKGGQICFVRKP